MGAHDSEFTWWSALPLAALLVAAIATAGTGTPLTAIVADEEVLVQLPDGFRVATGLVATEVVGVAARPDGIAITFRDARSCDGPMDVNATISSSALRVLEGRARAARDMKRGAADRAAARLAGALTTAPSNEGLKFDFVRALFRAQGTEGALRPLLPLDLKWAIRLALDDELGALIDSRPFAMTIPSRSARPRLKVSDVCHDNVFLRSADNQVFAAFSQQGASLGNDADVVFFELHDATTLSRLARFRLPLHCAAPSYRRTSAEGRALNRLASVLERFSFERLAENSVERAVSTSGSSAEHERWSFSDAGVAVESGRDGAFLAIRDERRAIAPAPNSGEWLAGVLRLPSLGVGWLQYWRDRAEGCRDDALDLARGRFFWLETQRGVAPTVVNDAQAW